MSLHAIIARLKYRRKAMGRHGMHSPFVYALVEDCIQKNRRQPLLTRISTYLSDWHWTELDLEKGGLEETVRASAGAHHQLFLVKSIHQTVAREQYWHRLRALDAVSYSIDLYDFGLLLIHPDFLEKQHFVLRKK